MVRLSACALLLVFTACAHSSAGPGAKEGQVHRLYEDSSLGYSLELPNDRRFRPGGGEGVAAVGEDGTVVRVFPLFVAGKAEPKACWERLFAGDVLPEGISPAPKDAEELAKRGPEGLERAGRRAHVQVFPREDSCLVLAIDAPAQTPAEKEALKSCVATAFHTFKVLPPADALKPLLAFEAGFQLLEAGEDVAALQRFEEALKLDPSLEKAHLGAGLAAFFAGKGYEQQAIQHLEKAVSQRADGANPEGNAFEDKQFKEALMNLGLAYASVKDYPKAKARLLEATERFPDDAIVQYNFACVLSLSGDADEAMFQLKGAFEKDPRLVPHAKEDEDLASLRGRPDFQSLVANAPAAGAGD